MIVMGEAHLRRLLRAYTDYYNIYQTHRGLNKYTPLEPPVHDRGTITPMPNLSGLHHAFMRIRLLVGTGEVERGETRLILRRRCRSEPVVRTASSRAGIPRRTLLMSAVAGAVACALPRFARAASAKVVPTASTNRRFKVLYAGETIGAHTITFSAASGQTRISTEIDLAVKALFFTVFSYSHRSEEIWRDGRLISLSSRTVEDGETIDVGGTATSLGFRVVSKGGPFIAPATTLTSNSLWSPLVLEQTTVVDAQNGGVIGVTARKIGDEQIAIGSRPVRATRYTFITPYLAGSIWYDRQNLWVRGDFERNGSKILYQLDT